VRDDDDSDSLVKHSKLYIRTK